MDGRSGRAARQPPLTGRRRRRRRPLTSLLTGASTGVEGAEGGRHPAGWRQAVFSLCLKHTYLVNGAQQDGGETSWLDEGDAGRRGGEWSMFSS